MVRDTLTRRNFLRASLLSSAGAAAALPSSAEKAEAAGRFSPQPPEKARLRLEVVRTLANPVIGPNNPDTHDIPGGFETGNTLKFTIDGRTEYHMIMTTMETTRAAKWTHLRMEHWVSADGLEWRRGRILHRPQVDPETGLWTMTSSQFPYFDRARDRWVIYYNFNALNGVRNWTLPCLLKMVEARNKGLGGINGEFNFPGAEVARSGYAHPTDADSSSLSTPFRAANGRWMAFLGGGPKPLNPQSGRWWVSLVSAPGPQGPFRYEPSYSPVPVMEPIGYVENPLPMKLRGPRTGREYWAIMFDYLRPEVKEGKNSTVGFSFSYDGLSWPKEHGQIVDINAGLRPGEAGWWRVVRTPHQLIHEGEGTYTCFFTGLYRDAFFAVGKMSVNLVEEVNS